MRTLITAIVAVIAIAAPTAARAQYTNPYTGNTFNNPGSSLLDTMIHNSMMTNMLMRYQTPGATSGGGDEVDGVVSGPAKRKPIKATDFKPGKKRVLKDAFLDSMGVDADQREVLSQIIDQTFKAYEGEARKNNVAYALAFLIAASVQIKTGYEITDEDAVSLALDINDLFAANKAFKKLKARQRQQLYETCIITGGLMVAFQALGTQTNEPTMIAAAEQMAEQTLGSFGGAN